MVQIIGRLKKLTLKLNVKDSFLIYGYISVIQICFEDCMVLGMVHISTPSLCKWEKSNPEWKDDLNLQGIIALRNGQEVKEDSF